MGDVASLTPITLGELFDASPPPPRKPLFFETPLPRPLTPKFLRDWFLHYIYNQSSMQFSQRYVIADAINPQKTYERVG